jgi:hypothetical protein
MASGDFAGASAHFAQCSNADEWCRWHRMMSAQKAGDTAGATAAREALLQLTKKGV